MREREKLLKNFMRLSRMFLFCQMWSRWRDEGDDLRGWRNIRYNNPWHYCVYVVEWKDKSIWLFYLIETEIISKVNRGGEMKFRVLNFKNFHFDFFFTATISYSFTSLYVKWIDGRIKWHQLVLDTLRLKSFSRLFIPLTSTWCATNFMKWPFSFRTWQFSYLCTSHSLIPGRYNKQKCNSDIQLSVRWRLLDSRFTQLRSRFTCRERWAKKKTLKTWQMKCVKLSGNIQQQQHRKKKTENDEMRMRFASSRSFHSVNLTIRHLVSSRSYLSRANMLQLYNIYSTTSLNRKAIKNLNISKLIID